MFDFSNATFLKLQSAGNDFYSEMLDPILVVGEQIAYTYRSIREGVVFTNKRIIIVQSKNDNDPVRDDKENVFTFLPLNRIQAYSVDTAKYIDQTLVLELWFFGLGIIKMEFYPTKQVYEICRMISEHVL